MGFMGGESVAWLLFRFFGLHLPTKRGSQKQRFAFISRIQIKKAGRDSDSRDALKSHPGGLIGFRDSFPLFPKSDRFLHAG